MLLSTDFQFSQASLQAFVDCPRRFYLRYVQRVKWPAPQAQPLVEHEERMQRGWLFHRLVQQHVLRVPEELLARAVQADELLARWWENYLSAHPAQVPGQRYPELVLSASLAGWRVMAKYDLVVVTPEKRWLIFDWKTARQRTSRRWLLARLQTRVYRYLLARAGACLDDGITPPPAQLEMVYWFANHPADPEHFPYDATQFAADEEYLSNLIMEICAGQDAADFPLTTKERPCRYCSYRSLCDRGKEAGDVDEMDEVPLAESLDDFDLDLEQIAEIEF